MVKTIQVYSKTSGEVKPFSPNKIKEKLINETTDLSIEEINRITNNVANKIRKDYSEISTSEIRVLVNNQLLNKNHDMEGSEVFGMTKQQVEELLEQGCKDNANISFSAQMVAKYMFDAVSKPYASSIMPKHIADAHNEGYIHQHDREYYVLGSNCFQYDIRFFARNGFIPDGKGETGAVSKPPKHMSTLLNHLTEAMQSGSVCLSGGQGIANFNTLLAPFARGLCYKEIYQEIQAFMFNCNQSLVSKGQIVFSSIGVDLSCPEVLADEPAVCPNNTINGTYKDYTDEANLIFKAICEISEKGDAWGQFFRFPNIIFNIRKGDIDEYKGNAKLLHELAVKRPNIYFANLTKQERTIMGALSSDTPVMTNKGFKYPYELNIGDEVMTYADDGSKEWNKIYNIIPKKAPSQVYEITLDNNYKFKVTDNHKLPTNQGIIKSEDLEVGMELYNYIDETFIPTDDYEAEFIGVFLADGYIRDENRVKNGKNSNQIDFHVKQGWKKDEIIRLCHLNNYNYTLFERNDGTYSICVNEKDLRNQLNQCYDSNGVKHFPSWVWSDKNIVANIIKGLMFDGRKGSKVRWDWSCSDLALVIDVLYALSYIGRVSTIYVDERSGDTGNWRTNYRVSFGLGYKPKNKTKIKSIELVDNEINVYDLSVENNPNYVCGLGGIHSENCRTQNPLREGLTYEDSCLNTGNFMYDTINLPLIAIESNTIDEYFNTLEYYCDLIKEDLLFRRSIVEKRLFENHMSDFLIRKDKETGIPMYDLDRLTYSIGFNGLYEALEILKNKDIDIDGEEIVKYLADRRDLYGDVTGLRWSLIGSPAESTSSRFAKICLEKYPHETVYQGTKSKPYFTNSSHLPVNTNENIVECIKNADKYHKYCNGGNILHIFTGEAWSDPQSWFSLNQKIVDTNVSFWAYTKDFSICNDCHYTINTRIDECPICGSKNIDQFSRVTGYMTRVKTWCDGKLQEFKDRVRYDF